MVSTYRGKGKDFTITSSTAFDQKWINGKNTYDSISNVVDEIFNSYLSRPEVTQPILTQYCDGKRVSCPEFMSQWGSKALGDDGLSAIEILRYYYGDDMYINEAETISGIPASYPGYELTIGASGQKVRQMQEQLNVIAGDYPLIPKIRVDGIYGPATANSVKIFQKIFANKNFWNSIRNTFSLNLLTLAVSFPLTIIVSLMINEVMHTRLKKIVQSILYLPHFISWVVVASIVVNLFSQNGGTINLMLNHLGINSIPFLSDKHWWIFTYVVSNVWKEIGWGTIIYLAALTGVDETLYEASYLDGATKFQRLIYITLPSIKSVIVVMLILQISKMMTIGLDAPLLLGNKKVMDVSEVISTYTYRIGIEQAKYSESTAIGLFQSVVNIVILFAADKFAKAIGEEGIL